MENVNILDVIWKKTVSIYANYPECYTQQFFQLQKSFTENRSNTKMIKNRLEKNEREEDWVERREKLKLGFSEGEPCVTVVGVWSAEEELLYRHNTFSCLGHSQLLGKLAASSRNTDRRPLGSSEPAITIVKNFMPSLTVKDRLKKASAEKFKTPKSSKHFGHIIRKGICYLKCRQKLVPTFTFRS